MYGTADEITEVMKKCKRFEFTARALGLACRYGGLEKVKALIDCGATFKYTPNGNLNKKYKVSYKMGGGREITTAYYLVLAETGITDIFYFSTARNLYGMISEDLPKISDEEKADIVEYLIDSNQNSFDKGLTLYYAILWGCDKVADRLISLGTKIDDSIIRYISESKGELCIILSILSAERCIKTMKSLNSFLEGQKLILNKGIISSCDSVFLSPEVLKYTIENTDISKIKRSEIIKSLVLNLRLPTLEMLAEKGWNVAKKEIDNVKKKYNKKIEEIHKHQDETITMSAEWESELLGNNTLKLTRYLRNDKKVIVPSHIGVIPVTVLGSKCFSPNGYRYRNCDFNEYPSKIESVVIPEGIKIIKVWTFLGCENMKEISLPSTLKEIKHNAFAYCNPELKNNIKVPQKVKYNESEAFENWFVG